MPGIEKENLGQMLIKAGLLTPQQLEEGLREQRKTGERLGRVLIKQGFLNEKDLLKALEVQLDVPYVSLSEIKIDPAVIAKVPANFVYRHNLIPLKEENGILTVAVADPLDIHVLDDIRLILGYEVDTVLSSRRDIANAIQKYYGVGAATIEKMVKDRKSEVDEVAVSADDKMDLEDMTSDASVIKFVNQVILEAYRSRATDIHLEPFENQFRIRYRIDGMLHETSTPPNIERFQSAIVSRVKLMANLNISEKRLPQDGRIKVKVGEEELDLRVSVVPTLFGESVAIRLLTRSAVLLDLEQLGIPPDAREQLIALLKKPHGIILVTGPTGCGKTTTLYAALNKINSVERKIITIEDPVEYQIRGVNQMQVKPKIDFTFANGLRSILRQDPDVIMVGEIRDSETAEIAIRAALTGHLVFSTLHTNDAAGGVTRLIDMGIEPYLIASSLEGIIAQRLVRVLCPKCKEQYHPDREYLEGLGFIRHGEKVPPIYKEKGCDECRRLGFSGRIAIFEILLLNDPIKQLILARASAGEIKKTAGASGMRTLRHSGWENVLAGITTVDEALRVTEEEEEADLKTA